VDFSSVHCSDCGRPLFKTKVAFREFERVPVLYIISTLLRSAAQSTLRIRTEAPFLRFLFLESLSRKKASGSALICYKLNGALSGRGLFRSFCRLSRSICSLKHLVVSAQKQLQLYDIDFSGFQTPSIDRLRKTPFA
jgi:hypothetical protein